MLTQKTNKNKNLILELVLVSIVLIIAFLLLKSLFFKTGSVNVDDNVSLEISDSPEKFESLDTSIFSDPKFKALKDNRAEDIDMENLDIGKENPFYENE